MKGYREAFSAVKDFRHSPLGIVASIVMILSPEQTAQTPQEGYRISVAGELRQPQPIAFLGIPGNDGDASFDAQHGLESQNYRIRIQRHPNSVMWVFRDIRVRLEIPGWIPVRRNYACVERMLAGSFTDYGIFTNHDRIRIDVCRVESNSELSFAGI
jgi:hypothetical protein